MIFNKEKKCFEIECSLEYSGSHEIASLKIVPKYCPRNVKICLHTNPYPIQGNQKKCDSYVGILEESSLTKHPKIYCKGSNAINFIIEE